MIPVLSTSCSDPITSLALNYNTPHPTLAIGTSSGSVLLARASQILILCKRSEESVSSIELTPGHCVVVCGDVCAKSWELDSLEYDKPLVRGCAVDWETRMGGGKHSFAQCSNTFSFVRDARAVMVRNNGEVFWVDLNARGGDGEDLHGESEVKMSVTTLNSSNRTIGRGDGGNGEVVEGLNGVETETESNRVAKWVTSSSDLTRANKSKDYIKLSPKPPSPKGTPKPDGRGEFDNVGPLPDMDTRSYPCAFDGKRVAWMCKSNKETRLKLWTIWPTPHELRTDVLVKGRYDPGPARFVSEHCMMGLLDSRLIVVWNLQSSSMNKIKNCNTSGDVLDFDVVVNLSSNKRFLIIMDVLGMFSFGELVDLESPQPCFVLMEVSKKCMGANAPRFNIDLPYFMKAWIDFQTGRAGAAYNDDVGLFVVNDLFEFPCGSL